MKRVTKAIIPAAGLGTRFLPATKAMPKEMLPIVDKPTIQYIVEEAIESGITDILIVTGRHKRAIEDHFDRNWELETTLKEKNKLNLLNIVENIANLADIHYIRQKQALGLGHAVSCARKFIGNEPFAVLLGDIVTNDSVPCLKQLLEVYQEKQSSVIAVQNVPWEEVSHYGVIQGNKTNNHLHQVLNLIEKPTENPPSNLAMIGRYILEPAVFDQLENVSTGVGGEIQLTDALRQLAIQEPLYALEFQGRVYDIGNKFGFLKATVEFALRDQEIDTSFYTFLQNYINSQTKVNPNESREDIENSGH